MVLSFDDLVILDPDQLWLEFSPDEQRVVLYQSWSQAYSNDAARWRAYLNHLCLDVFQRWLAAEPDLPAPVVWPQISELPSFWEIVNGTAITLGETRLVLIPSDAVNLEELRVPQEWVDIPSWAADYYLAIQLNLEEHWLRVSGYATHDQLKREGQFDPMDRTICLNQECLTEDLNILWVTQELFSRCQPAVKPLPTLSSATAATLLNQLSQSAYSPRLDRPFEQWAALIANQNWREQLYQGRQSASNRQQPISPMASVNLSQWIQGIFAAGWQVVEELVAPTAVLVPVAKGADTVQRAKQINLGNCIVALVVTREPEANQEVSITIQVKPTDGQTTLPTNLQLSAFDQSETIYREVQAKHADPEIELPRLIGSPGESFSVKVALGDFSVTQDFVI